MNLKKVIKQKTGILENLIAKIEEEGRAFSKEEQELFDSTKAEIEDLKNAVKQADDLAKFKEELRASVTPPTGAGASPDIQMGGNRSHDKPWNDFGEFLNAVAKYSDPSNRVIDERLYGGLPKNSTGLQVTVGSDGGFMVGTQFVTKLMDSIMDESSLLSRITMIPISEGNSGISVPTLSESSRANGSRWGGIQSFWVNEGGPADASKPKFGELAMKLSKLLAFTYVTDELLRDSAALETWVMGKVPKEIAFRADDAILNGSGNGIPLGILNGSGLIAVPKETSQVNDTVVYANIVKMWIRCPARVRKNAVWLINQEAEAQLIQMSQLIKNVAGTENVGGVPVYMPAGGVQNAPYSTLYGRPVLVTEQCPKLGDAGDIVLADLTDYIGIDKGKITTDTSIHVNFLYDEQVFRFRYRFNGAPYTQNAVASYANSSFSMSPYITLAAR